jgi:hypothetical protein
MFAIKEVSRRQKTGLPDYFTVKMIVGIDTLIMVRILNGVGRL